MSGYLVFSEAPLGCEYCFTKVARETSHVTSYVLNHLVYSQDANVVKQDITQMTNICCTQVIDQSMLSEALLG